MGYAARLGLLSVAAAMFACPTHAIERSSSQVRAFRVQHPCPSTGNARGACPGHQVDHIRPLCMGGEDKASNMQWMAIDDHKWKTFVDVRECAKFKASVSVPAIQRRSP